MIFIRVDLPAPFSPISAWTVPGRILQPDAIEGHDAGKFLAHSLHLQEIRRLLQYSGDLGFVEGFVRQDSEDDMANL